MYVQIKVETLKVVTKELHSNHYGFIILMVTTFVHILYVVSRCDGLVGMSIKWYIIISLSYAVSKEKLLLTS